MSVRGEDTRRPAARPAYSLRDIAARFGGEVRGDADVAVDQVATLESASGRQIAFLANPKYRRQLETTRAAAVIVGPDMANLTRASRIVCDDPYAYFARLSSFLNPPAAAIPGIHSSAVVDPTAQVDVNACIGPMVSIGPEASVGPGTTIHAGCSLGCNAVVGADCVLYSNVSVYHECVIGDRVILHAGAVIGADGFGLAWDAGGWRKIPQIGRVVIGNDVEIGANTTIDRGALDDTIIEDGAKLDNQIQIGHNCRIGAHTAIAGCAGIAGSTRIGRYCRIGGSAMIGGHLEICDNVEISGASVVSKSIIRPGTYTAVFPLARHEDWLHNASHIRHLDALAGRVRELEARLAQMERNRS